MTRLTVPILSVAAAAALAVAGCGGSSNNDNNGGSASSAPSTQASQTSSAAATTTTSSGAASSGKSTTLNISADPGGALAFKPGTLTAKAGKVTITMSNPSSAGIPHAVAIEGNGVDQDGATANPGQKSTVSVTLKPGKYTFYCPVDGHRQAGMEGTLTVQ